MLNYTPIDYDKRFQQESFTMIELGALKKMFENRPSKSTTTLNCKCSACGEDMLIEITHTSGGYGLNGGFLVEDASDKYLVRCRDCYHLDNKISQF